MEIVYFTFAAIALYFVSDWILLKIEHTRGKPFAQRSIIFFGIILILAISLFKIIELLANR